MSNKTLEFLDGAFETERAYGEKREEMLRAANITTYFIVKTLKPVGVAPRPAASAQHLVFFLARLSRAVADWGSCE